MGFTDQGMGLALRALNGVAGSTLLDRLGLRKQAERILFEATRSGFKATGAAARTFTAVQRRGRPARQGKVGSRGLFDLTPTEEQQMLQEAFGELAERELRPRAGDADAACAAPDALLKQINELGLVTLGVPEELGGAVEERSAMTTVLVAERLAHGDVGLATAALAPGAVATALGLWGDATQQATYLPAFAGEDPPAAALALLEPQPLFDPFALTAQATRAGTNGAGGYVLDGVKALVPRAADAELFVVGAALPDGTPGLFLVEANAKGVSAAPDPAMGVRAAATAKLALDGASVPAGALLGGGDPKIYAECVLRARLAWCALSVGCAQAVLDYVIPYVNERVAFGEPISNRQAVAFMVADIAIELDGMRLTTWRAATRADRGEDFARETALARALCAEKGMQIGSNGVQLLGGHGYVKEHPVERWYRDLRAIGVMEGALLV